MTEFRFTVPGKIHGKGRPRFAKIGGFVKTYTDAQTVNYENWIRLQYQQAGGPMFEGPVEMSIIARFALPKSCRRITENIGQPCEKKPDADNILKAVADALNGMAYADDKSIWSARITKGWDIADQIEITLKGATKSEHG